MRESNEQLEFINNSFNDLSIGTEITGEIVKKNADSLIISIPNYKYEGYLPFNEITFEKNDISFLDKYKLNDKITAKVIKLKDQNNHVVLSILEYEKQNAFKKIDEIYKSNETITLNVDETKENGLVSYYKGIRIFIPLSQIDTKFINDTAIFKNKHIEVKIIDFDISNPSRVVASSRILKEQEFLLKEEKAWDSIKVNDIVSAEIKRFTKFGAFANVNGIDGLIHLSQISWNHVKKAEDYLKSGDIINVKVIDIDKASKKLSLSLKELSPKPWENIEVKYPTNSIVLGKVVRINDFGAFVELEDGVDGLVHISKISHNRIEHPSDVLTVGQEIKAKILTVDKNNKRISLSIKDV